MVKHRKSHLDKVDTWLVLSTALLLALSALMVFSTTSVTSEELYGSRSALITRHIIHIFLGLLALTVCYFTPLSKLRRCAPVLFLGTLLLLSLVLIPGVGHMAGGARRWLSLGPFRFQPGELAKLAVLLYMATYIGRHHSRMFSFRHGAFIPLCIVGFVGLLLLLEPDFGSTVVIAGIVFFQLLTSSRLLHLLGLGCAGFLGLLALALSSPYRFARLKIFLDPFSDPTAGGYQVIQSLIAVGSGGLTGAGLGGGKQKLFYLPAAHTDFIYAVIAEELGIIGALFVLGIFLLIGFRGLAIAKRLSQNPYYCSLAVGSTLLIVLPALLNMGVVLGMLPTKGMVLPLVGYGGSAMVVYLAVMGILLRLSKTDAEL